jgi:type IV secretion system protein VirB10
MAHPPSEDPRTELEDGSNQQAMARAGVLPVVRRSKSGLPAWVLMAGALVFGLVLFSMLNARRQALTAPAVRTKTSEAVSTGQPLPTLYIPPDPTPSAPAPISTFVPVAPIVRASPVPVQPTYRQPSQSQPVIQNQQPSYIAPPASPPQRVAGEPALVIDNSSPNVGNGNPAGPPGAQRNAEPAVTGTRAAAGVFSNPATTVPQGTIVPAVLETALDSTRPGLARAIVSHDVRGFDGSRVLIPRGSRLVGEVGSQAEPGQNRILVNWVRLIRPDGATIALASPAGDPLGRGGIRASVNSHFFERFAGAILQSALDIGVNLASRSAGSPTIVALPGSLQGATRSVGQNQVRPTLKVKPATSISVLVARDLDFTSVENR